MQAETPKQYLRLADKTVLEHTLNTLLACERLSGVVLVLSASDQHWPEIEGRYQGQALETVTGGAERCHSVLNGLHHLADKSDENDWVLVHDAARPCLSPGSLDRLLEQGLQSEDGAILAMPVGDTLKHAGEDQEITSTVDRSGLWAAQTPQLFHVSALSDAIDAAQRDGRELTDEASAMELAGARPKLVMGSAANIKITHPSDLAIAEAWLNWAKPQTT